MEDTNTKTEQAAEMRRRAEEIYLNEAPPIPENPAALSPEELRKILHELRVHQIQLEMQNEELRRTHAELDAQRGRYFDLYDMAPAGYITISTQGVILEANLTVCDMLGETRNMLTQRPFSKFIHSDDQNAYYLNQKALTASGTLQRCELRLMKKDGHAFWARLDASCANDADGAPTYRVIITDITERKRTEKVLAEQEAKYRSIFENASESIFVVDTATEIILDVNKNAEILTGRSREELMGMNRILIHPRDQAEFYKQHFRHHVMNSGTSSSDAIVEKKDGTRVPVRISASVMELAGRKVILGLFEDISERKKAEELINQGVANLLATLDATADGILAIDPEGKIVFSNRQFAELAYTQNDDRHRQHKKSDGLCQKPAYRPGCFFKGGAAPLLLQAS